MDLKGRVAVVTGAASGIGFALASRFGAEGMRVVLADVEAATLQDAARELEKRGVETLPVPTDVAQAEQVDALAEQTLAAFGAVHVVCNNAGVIAAGLSWEAPLEDYRWVLGVNLWGVIHGIRAFVPILLERGEEGHIVNTASMAAVTSMPYTGIYNMSKHAVLALSESLYHELGLRGARVGVTVLCPELVATRIHRAERNRPDHLKPGAGQAASDERDMVLRALSEGVEHGLPPERMAERVVDAIHERRFYVLSEEVWRRTCETRLDDIRLGRNPTFAPPAGDETG
jgi:NAD(P)-dependent dehydrogenase (short-subunit alcohol dehydrogenase family)